MRRRSVGGRWGSGLPGAGGCVEGLSGVGEPVGVEGRPLFEDGVHTGVEGGQLVAVEPPEPACQVAVCL